MASVFLSFGFKTVSILLQTRGSIPFFWSQRPNLKYKPKPQISKSVNHVSGFLRLGGFNIFLGSCLCDRVPNCNQKNKNQQYWVELYVSKVVARGFVLLKISSEPEKNPDCNGRNFSLVYVCNSFSSCTILIICDLFNKES